MKVTGLVLVNFTLDVISGERISVWAEPGWALVCLVCQTERAALKGPYEVL